MTADGLCAIDISTGDKRGTVDDIALYTEISAAGDQFLRKCVTDTSSRRPPIGGRLGGVGMSKPDSFSFSGEIFNKKIIDYDSSMALRYMVSYSSSWP